LIRRQRLLAGQIAAVLAATWFVALGFFQLALALGAPLGHAAWGGDSADLTSSQRTGSAISVVVFALAAAVVLARGPYELAAKSGAAEIVSMDSRCTAGYERARELCVAKPLGELRPRPQRGHSR
jgi:hypothetical protein